MLAVGIGFAVASHDVAVAYAVVVECAVLAEIVVAGVIVEGSDFGAQTVVNYETLTSVAVVVVAVAVAVGMVWVGYGRIVFAGSERRRGRRKGWWRAAFPRPTPRESVCVKTCDDYIDGFDVYDVTLLLFYRIFYNVTVEGGSGMLGGHLGGPSLRCLHRSGRFRSRHVLLARRERMDRGQTRKGVICVCSMYICLSVHVCV
jgi:hypothetical protein